MNFGPVKKHSRGKQPLKETLFLSNQGMSLWLMMILLNRMLRKVDFLLIFLRK